MMIVNDQNQRTRRLAILCIVCFVLQLAIAPFIAIGAGHVNFCLICAFTAAFMGGGVAPIWVAFISGIFFDLTSTTPVGLMALLLVLAAFLLNPGDRDRLVDEPVRCLRDGAIMVLGVELVYQLMLLLVAPGAPFIDMVFLRWLPASLLDWLCLVPFVLVLSRTKSDVLTLGGGAKKSFPGKRYKL